MRFLTYSVNVQLVSVKSTKWGKALRYDASSQGFYLCVSLSWLIWSVTANNTKVIYDEYSLTYEMHWRESSRRVLLKWRRITDNSEIVRYEIVNPDVRVLKFKWYDIGLNGSLFEPSKRDYGFWKHWGVSFLLPHIAGQLFTNIFYAIVPWVSSVRNLSLDVSFLNVSYIRFEMKTLELISKSLLWRKQN